MLDFKGFFKEDSKIEDYNHLLTLITEYQKQGRIPNPEFQRISSAAKRMFEKENRRGKDLLLNMRGKDGPDAFTTLYWDWPSDSFVSLNKFEKSVKAFSKESMPSDYKPGANMLVKMATKIITDWKPIADALKDLKSKVVKATEMRAAVKDVKQKTQLKQFSDSSSLVKELEKHIDEYKQVAKERAEKFIKDRIDFLKKHDMDLNKAVPMLSYKTSSATEIEMNRAKRSLYQQITKSTSSSGRINDADIRVVNKQMVDKYVIDAVDQAEQSYMSFIYKLITKIGKPVVKAKMTGNIWTNAVLTVMTHDKEEQVWNTQMILNFSKYQRMFNQFPTRRKK